MLSAELVFRSLCVVLLFSGCSDETAQLNYDKLMLAKINEMRAAGCTCGDTEMPGVDALSINEALNDAAQVHAQDMAAKNYFDHMSPEGVSPHGRVTAAGYTGYHLFENIGKGDSADDIIKAWQSSESHCKAIMDERNQEIGLSKYHRYWVAEFGQRK